MNFQPPPQPDAAKLASFAAWQVASEPPQNRFSPAGNHGCLILARRRIYSCCLEGGSSTVILAIALMTVMTVAVCTFFLAPQLGEARVLFGTEPDHPCEFGYKMSWLAVRTRDTRSVVEALGLIDAIPCNWDSGVGTVYDDRLGERHIFVTPPVKGWTFVIGLSLPHPVGRQFVDKCTPLMVGLGGRFPEVQYYFSYPPLDFFAWARMMDGRLVRAFAAGDEGVVWSKGKTTREEKALGLKSFELRGVSGRKGDAGGELILHPTEDHVMRIAQAWSLDPTRLDPAKAEPALGYIALSPGQWRTERARKAA